MPMIGSRRATAVAGIVVAIVAIASAGSVLFGAGDARAKQPGTVVPPGVMVGPTVMWMDAVAARTPQAIPGPAGEAMLRTTLAATDTHLYFIDETPHDDPIQQRVLCRVALPAFDGPAGQPEEAEVERLLPLGRYPFQYHLLRARGADGQRITQLLVAQQTLDTNGDDRVDRDDRVSLRIGTDNGDEAGIAWRLVRQLPAGSWVAGVMPIRREAIVGVPAGESFERDFQLIPLDGAAAGNNPDAAGPRVLATGIGIGAVDPLERYVIVTSLGDRPQLEPGLRRDPGEIDPDDPIDPDERLRYPFTHEIVPINADESTVILSRREEPMMVRTIHNDLAYVEQTLATPADVDPGYPTRQSQHAIEYYDLSTTRTPVRIPMSRPGIYDDEFLAVDERHGVLLLRNSAFGRELRLFTGSDRRNEPIRRFSPLTVEFALTPRRDRLFWLEYADEAERPFVPNTQPTVVRWLDLRTPGAVPD